jgi:hypothetical protein
LVPLVAHLHVGQGSEQPLNLRQEVLGMEGISWRWDQGYRRNKGAGHLSLLAPVSFSFEELSEAMHHLGRFMAEPPVYLEMPDPQSYPAVGPHTICSVGLLGG